MATCGLALLCAAWPPSTRLALFTGMMLMPLTFVVGVYVAKDDANASPLDDLDL